MLIAVLFFLCVLVAGWGVVRLLGLAKGLVGVGLAPPAGLAILTVVSSWLVLVGAPVPMAGLAVYGVVFAAAVLLVRDGGSILTAARLLCHEQQDAMVLLVVVVTIPLIVMGFAFAGVQVPLSPHDGAFHTETIQAIRLGQAWSGWYPPGLAALFGAWLMAVPWVDSAQGAFELGLALPPLASLAMFGLGVAVWRDPRVAAVGALLFGFTYLYPYFPELWSGWPLALSLILVIGVWGIALAYLNRADARLGVLGGLLLGAVVLVHGSELYTLLIVLPIVLLAGYRRVVWRNLGLALGLSFVVAFGCAAVYLPNLFGWASGGGAYAAGLADRAVSDGGGVTVSGVSDLLTVFALDSLGIDLPVRLGLLALGVAWAFKRRIGRSVVVTGVVFGLLAVTFTVLIGVPALRQIYAVTFPWAIHYRLLMIVTITQALLAGAGAMFGLRWIGRRANGPGAWARRARRVTRILVVTWALLLTWGMVIYLAQPTGVVLGYNPDDAAAMAWLQHDALPGEVLANDGYADAGIWAPYKAGLPILLPRLASAREATDATLVIDNVNQLDQVAAAAMVLCAKNVRYVYRGARASEWDKRRFPSLDELRRSPALEEVFSRGEAVVFRTRISC